MPSPNRSHITTIAQATDLAHTLISEVYTRDPSSNAFDQLGIVDGSDMVHNYIKYNEPGLALDHLLYMIHSIDIDIPRDLVLQLHEIAKEWGINKSCDSENLTTEQRATLFNVP